MSAHVSLTGNVGKAPELRFTASGQATCTFSLAVNRKWQNKATQQWEEQTSWFKVVCWRELAENVAESVNKGDRVSVSGRLEQRSWEDNEGKRQSIVEIVADEVGPSLRYATAQTTKAERSNSGATARTAPEPVGAGYDFDEEPF